jgi:hypothetical protein
MSASVHEQVHTALQTSIAEDEEIEGSVLTSWCAVMEVVDPEGRRWLCWRTGGGLDGSTDPSTWLVEGMLRHSLRKLIDNRRLPD